ncbi:MAG TPA: hypothetical protein VJT73_06835 [Polyangiaceae bacterium]|nr:hypothetical protein [Polyangiaceae bacterium]
MNRVRFLLAMIAFAALSAVLSPRSSFGVERNFAGSGQLDYHLIPRQPAAGAPKSSVDAFTAEFALKLAVDISDHVSANVKVCYGCHGFELGMAYFDYRLADELNVRVGRFSPSFGAFTLRHDPANHYLSDKPLPYDMGRMLRSREWNQGVLPSPFPDNGIEVDGTHWFGNSVELDYAAWAVTGFKADSGSFDLDFQKSHAPYYIDNNSRPAVGARLAATLRLSASSDLTLGASAQYGRYDPDNRLAYTIVGSDVSLRLGRTDLRFEWLARRQEIDAENAAALRFDVASQRGTFFVKQGAYVEVKHPLTDEIDIIGRVDGMYRNGNLPALSPLSLKSTVLRYTLGTMFPFASGLRGKLSAELWDFSDPDAAGNHTEVTFHAAVVGTY